jgi:ABC-type multidrug transport system fused ATPase/permease subunit
VNDPARLSPTFWTLLPELYRYLSPQRRRHLYLLLALMVLGAVAELATLGSLLPFLSLLAGVDQPARIPSLARLFVAAGATTPREQIWVAATLFAAIALLAGAIRLSLNWSTQMFTALLSQELSGDVQRRILLQPYIYHLTRNSSEAVAAMDKVQSLVVHVLLQLIYATAGAVMAVVIMAALIYLDPFTAIIAAAAFALLYLIVSAVTRPRLARNSEEIRTTYDERVRIVQESVGGIRDVIIDGAQDLYLDAFAKVSRRNGVASATTTFIAAAPRFIIESVGMVVIAIVALLIAGREGGLANALPLLGAVALGAQRLLPLVQQVYHGWASVSGHRSVAFDVVELLRLPISPEGTDLSSIEPLPLRDNISIERVSFSYPGRRRPVLEEVTLEIPRGSILGIVGKTGSGKSTLADLIMGLIEPTEGQIAVDGLPLIGGPRRRWLRGIAHVPQAIFLADTNIAQNIAFGVTHDLIDQERVRAAAATAQLHEFVASLPDGYATTIGERGVRLSGGQRQRLGIARAIYKQTQVLVLDEATSALDDVTEASVMEALEALGEKGRTIIIIAHRLSTLARCGLLVRLEEGRVAVTGKYAEVVAQRPANANPGS